MTAESFESEPESELAYWKCRVANLEIVVCELLVKNERLRRELQNVSLSALKPGKSTDGFPKGANGDRSKFPASFAANVDPNLGAFMGEIHRFRGACRR